MPTGMVEWSTLAVIVMLVSGAGLYLRLVAKELRRRNNYLKLRLEKERHEAELEQNRKKLEEEGRSPRKRRGGEEEPEPAEPITATPVSASAA